MLLYSTDVLLRLIVWFFFPAAVPCRLLSSSLLGNSPTSAMSPLYELSTFMFMLVNQFLFFLHAKNNKSSFIPYRKTTTKGRKLVE